jgi:hypothetical protein
MLPPKEFVREWTRISANKTKWKETSTEQNLCSLLFLQFSAAVPSLIWHNFRKIWFGKKKAEKERV